MVGIIRKKMYIGYLKGWTFVLSLTEQAGHGGLPQPEGGGAGGVHL